METADHRVEETEQHNCKYEPYPFDVLYPRLWIGGAGGFRVKHCFIHLKVALLILIMLQDIHACKNDKRHCCEVMVYKYAP